MVLSSTTTLFSTLRGIMASSHVLAGHIGRKRRVKLSVRSATFARTSSSAHHSGTSTTSISNFAGGLIRSLMVAAVVVVLDELADALFKLSWQIVVFQQDPIFHRAVVSLDLALCDRVVSSAADVADSFVLKPLAKLARHVGWTVVAQ